MDYREKCIKALADVTGLEFTEVDSLAETPPNPEMGDLAMPCFQFAKKLKKAPQAIAQEFAECLAALPYFKDKIEVKGPYLNIFYDRAAFAESIFTSANNCPGKLLGHKDEPKNKVVLVDYSSPNIAKPFHVGHGFSTILGAAICDLFEYHGYTVKRLNHLGDYGTQFGRLIYAWLHWGDEEALKKEPIKELTRVYVKFHEEADHNPDLYDAARLHFKRLEDGEEEEYKLWELFRKLSIEEFERIYKRLDVHFDSYDGESFYSDKMPAAIQVLRDKSLLEESENAQVVRLDEYNLNPCIIIKSDGSSIYATRDITALLYRDKTWDFYRNIYVVGQEQSNHFKQVFAVIDKLGHPKAGQSKHVAFGRLSFGDMEFSTRHGNIVRLEDFIDETYAHVYEIMQDSDYPQVDNAEEIAEAIAIASVKFLYLKSGREHNISTSWEELLDFNGDTAPYLLYAYARARSILRKADEQGITLTEAKVSLLTSDEEFSVLKELALLEEDSLAALREYEPSILVRCIIKLVREFNRFYQAKAILKAEDEALRVARLDLCRLFAEQLKIALAILGIKVVESM